MSITLTPVKTFVEGNQKRVIQTIALDSSYPTGGYALTGSTLGCDVALHDVTFNQGTGGYVYNYDYTASKVKLFWSNGTGAVLSEVTNATDVSAVTALRVCAVGKGVTVYAP